MTYSFFNQINTKNSQLPLTSTTQIKGNTPTDSNTKAIEYYHTAERKIATPQKTISNFLPANFKDFSQSNEPTETELEATTNTIAQNKVLELKATITPASISNLAPIEALKAIQNSQPENSLGNQVGFLTKNRSNNRHGQIPLADAATATPTVIPEDTVSLTRLGGQARGYVLLSLMHPNARQTIDAQVDTLIKANIAQVYIGVLVDGTFGKDHSYLHNILDKLNAAGCVIYLEQYLISGPTMRKFSATPILTDFSHTDPISFRTANIYSDYTQNKIRQVAREARGSFEKNNSLNRANISLVSVMLEDNLENVSYRFLRKIVAQEIGGSAKFIRNPCPGCWQGNDSERAGDPLENHEISRFSELESGDGYTLDGVDVLYPTDPARPSNISSKAIDVEELKSYLNEAITKDLQFFGLWRRERQGLTFNSETPELTHPDNRTYLVPTDAEKKIDIELLREGLTPVD